MTKSKELLDILKEAKESSKSEKRITKKSVADVKTNLREALQRIEELEGRDTSELEAADVGTIFSFLSAAVTQLRLADLPLTKDGKQALSDASDALSNPELDL